MEVDNGNGLVLEYQPTGKAMAAVVTARINGDVLACEKIDLAKEKQRQVFADTVCDGRPGIDNAAVRNELLKLAADRASRGNGDDKPTDETEPDPLAAMPEAVRTQARAMLESPDLLQRILDDIGVLAVAGERELAAGYGGDSANAAADGIIERHHALQRMLQGQSVVIPFAARLGELMTPERVEARRAFPQLASMIQASALLHQLQRKVDPDGRLVAEPDDYQIAQHLLAKPLGRLLGGRLSDPAARFLERLRGWVASGDSFTGREAAREETASRRSVYGWLSELHDAGRVEQVEAARGSRAAVWRLADGGTEADCPILPTKEQIFGSGE